MQWRAYGDRQYTRSRYLLVRSASPSDRWALVSCLAWCSGCMCMSVGHFWCMRGLLAMSLTQITCRTWREACCCLRSSTLCIQWKHSMWLACVSVGGLVWCAVGLMRMMWVSGRTCMIWCLVAVAVMSRLHIVSSARLSSTAPSLYGLSITAGYSPLPTQLSILTGRVNECRLCCWLLAVNSRAGCDDSWTHLACGGMSNTWCLINVVALPLDWLVSGWVTIF